MNNYKKIIILFAVILTCILFYYIANTFAKYLTSVQQTTDITIARWNIKVNNASVQNNSATSFVIQPVFPGNNHIASNIIAPTAEGYFDLAFDFTNVDVSFEYEVSVSPNADSSVSDLIVTGYSIDNGQVITFDPQNGIKDIILYNSGVTAQDVRIYIKWDDSSNAQMNNIEDTAATAQSANGALLDVSITFRQITRNYSVVVLC